MKRNRTGCERLLALFLCLVLFIGLVPGGILNAFAEEPGEDNTNPSESTDVKRYDNVTALTGDLTITEDDDGNITVTNDKPVTLEFVKDDDGYNRGADGWWVGIGVTAPEGMAEDAYLVQGGNEYRFEDCKDGDGYITLWSLVNPEKLSKDSLSYTWEFYWDGEEADPQVITLNVDKDQIILLNEDKKTRAYPSAYGTLALAEKQPTLDLTDATVTTEMNEENGETTLTVKNAKVTYDTETKTWHMDVTVTAPAHISEAKEGENEFTSPATYYLELVPENGKDAVSGELSGTFYWDGVEQKMTLKAENITLTGGKEQDPLTFAIPADNEGKIYVYARNDSFTNAATGGNTDEAIQYGSSNEEIAKVNSDGKVTFQKYTSEKNKNQYKTGTVTITATRPGNGEYEDASTSYTLVILADNAISFTTRGTVTLTYGENNNKYTNQAYYYSGNSTKNDVNYSSSDTNAASVSSNKNSRGEVTVKSSTWNAENGKYDSIAITATKGNNSATYNLIILRAEQTLNIEGETKIEYDSSNTGKTYPYAVEGIKSTGEITVSSSNPDAASAAWDENSKKVVVTPEGEGSFTLTVKVKGDNKYNDAEQTMEIKVENALLQQSGVDFEKQGNQAVTYGEAFSNPLVDNQETAGKGAITYQSSDENIAEVDNEGKVTIKKSTWDSEKDVYSAVTITATKASDGVYAEAKYTYELTIKKAEQKIEFENAVYDSETECWSAQVSNSEQSYEIKLKETQISEGKKYSYALAEDNKDWKLLGVSVDENGTVTIPNGSHGTVTITVTYNGDDCYEKWKGTLKLEIQEIVNFDGVFSIEGDLDENTGWYTSKAWIVCENYSLDKHDDTKNWGHDRDDWSAEYELKDGEYTKLELCVNGYGVAHNIDVLKKLDVDVIRVDSTPPEASISYSKNTWNTILEAMTFGSYKAPVTVTITATDATSGVAKICYNYDGNWVEVKPDENGEVTFTINSEYKGQVTYYAVDNAGNRSDKTTDDETLIVDGTAPEICVSWSDAVNTTKDTRYYAEKAVATVTIKEANFFGGEDVVITGGKFDGEWTPAKDEDGNEIADTWVNTVTLKDEGDYTVVITYSDRSGNPMEGDGVQAGTYTAPQIVIDQRLPVVTLPKNLDKTCTNQDLTVTVTVEEHSFEDNCVTITLNGDQKDVKWKKSKETDTYTATFEVTEDGIYEMEVTVEDLAGNGATKEASFTVDKNAPNNLKISYSDAVLEQVLEKMTFGFYNAKMTVTIHAEDATSGVAKIYYNYKGDDWKEATPDKNGNISFHIKPQYRGQVKYYAVDKAGNSTKTATANTTLVVDNIKPGIQVSWSDAVNTTKDTRYYAGKAVATVTIKEANFFGGEDVVITGGKFDGEWTAAKDEKGKTIKNTWVNTVTLKAEGDHTLTIAYTDKSKNEMDTYTSPKIVIDRTDPVITASGAAGGFCNEAQTIRVTVTEKNFDAKKVDVRISAVDSAGVGLNADVTYGEWKGEGDVHTMDVTFTGDANYVVTAECTDLAGRRASMAAQSFTVDKAAPTGMAITYSQSVKTQVLNGVTFGYYDAPATVNITAVDATAGIESFSYQYVLNNGVSSVNQGGTGTVAANREGNTYMASFQIPESILTATNQFNGYIIFTATDRSGNTSVMSHQGSQTVIVDSISPTATVTYNDPNREVNDIAYYAGDIDVTISINEANFDSGDVAVTVTRDDDVYDVDVTWVNNSADSHTGTFTLTEEGDYRVSVAYTDKSGNRMNPYTSQQLTLDTTLPEIRVSNITANSANKDAVYGFAITIQDTNLDAASMKPVLLAVKQNENGRYTTSQVELGEPVSETDGQTYTYTVANLPEDALYTLSCEGKDLAGNTTNTVKLDDGKSYGEVQFSVNRNGSTFGFGDDYTEGVVNQYYVYEIGENVTVVEVNVDPIEDYVVLLNGVELKEGTDYTTAQTSNSGEWSKRSYVINKALFADEGEYSIVVSSRDKTETTAYSDVKNLSVAFAVDRTAPVLTISGLETGGRYQTNGQVVTVIPTDDGGRLESMTVLVLDSRGNRLRDEAGNDISVRFDMSGEEFLSYLEEHDGKVSFTVPEGLNNQVQITCSDAASKADGTTNACNESFKRVTVSQNQLVIFYANTPLFVGMIIGALALIFVIILLVKRRKSKKNGK